MGFQTNTFRNALRLAGIHWFVIFLFVQTPGCAAAGLHFQSEGETQSFFGGETGRVRVTWHNPQSVQIARRLRLQLFQTSSATAAPISEQSLPVVVALPWQTVVQTNAVFFPDVRTETRFFIRWIDQSDQIIGSAEVSVFPGDLLKHLSALADNRPVGLYDPEQRVTPLLSKLPLKLESLENFEINAFTGRLVIIGPFQLPAQSSFNLIAALEQLAGRSVGIVWIQPRNEPDDSLKPSFYVVRKNSSAVVIVQHNFVRDLAVNPRAQWRLIELCRLALNPEPFSLPDNVF